MTKSEDVARVTVKGVVRSVSGPVKLFLVLAGEGGEAAGVAA